MGSEEMMSRSYEHLIKITSQSSHNISFYFHSKQYGKGKKLTTIFFLFLSQDEQNILSGLNMSYFIAQQLNHLHKLSFQFYLHWVLFCCLLLIFFSFFMFVLGNLSLISPGSVLLLLLVLCGFTSYQTCIVGLFAGCYSC